MKDCAMLAGMLGLCMFLAAGCGGGRLYQLANGRYFLHFHFADMPRSEETANQTVTVDMVRQGESVIMTDPKGKAFPMAGRLAGNDFALHRDHAGETFDLVGKLLSDNRMAGNIGTMERDGSFVSAGTWTLEPAED